MLARRPRARTGARCAIAAANGSPSSAPDVALRTDDVAERAGDGDLDGRGADATALSDIALRIVLGAALARRRVLGAEASVGASSASASSSVDNAPSAMLRRRFDAGEAERGEPADKRRRRPFMPVSPAVVLFFF
jgi:hypothetical protein